MTIEELAIITETQLNFRWSKTNECFFVALKCIHTGRTVDTSESMDSGIFTASYGTAKFKAQAKQDYCKEIQGKILVTNTMSSTRSRRRYPLPKIITLELPE